ncbi:MAG: cytochrome c-type biogenesis protein [Gemmatimonadota bacterium]
MRWYSRALLLVALTSAAAPGQSGGRPGSVGGSQPIDSAALERRTREVASQLRCPVCQGLSINDSPSELALEMKALVRDQLAAGKSPDQVRGYFIEKYGEWVLLEPAPRGVNLFVYLLPVLAVAAGGMIIWRAVRRWTAAPGGASGG